MFRRTSLPGVLALCACLLVLATAPARAVDRTGTDWYFWYTSRLDDTFYLEAALVNTAEVSITDPHGVESAIMFASSDKGAHWEDYELIRQGLPGDDDWWAPPPVNQIAPATEIWYYFEARDGLGTISRYPEGAPCEFFEFSILPIHGSLEEPSILLVDKVGDDLIPGEFGQYWPAAEFPYKEALDSLGFEYDTYDVPAPWSVMEGKSQGPDSTAMDYYDTQIWFGSNTLSYFLRPQDSVSLPQWLLEASSETPRNLLVATNNLWHDDFDELMGYEFVHPWVTPPYDGIQVSVQDVPGGADFMTHNDGSCLLHVGGGDYTPNTFDVIQPRAGVLGTEVAIEAVRPDSTTRIVGVACTDPATGRRTRRLGFGIDCMMGNVLVPPWHYDSGFQDRLNLMANIMDYFGKEPPSTGIPGETVLRGGLGFPHPNPFNPQVSIAYGIDQPGRVSIAVYNIKGQLVCPLLDADVGAGGSGTVAWDGRDSCGRACASGMYFCRLEAPGQVSERKLVLLK